SEDQRAAADTLVAGVAAHAFQPVLLDGVTGSGKTEVYLETVAAALAAGNAVLAKPAEQTPLIAAEAVRLYHAAGLDPNLLALTPGRGETVGAALTAHDGLDGVAFTGGTDTAWKINQTLAQRQGPIVPFIAETGGLNGMFVDTTALKEQVVDDVVISAVGSAGQRCSA
ncbi:aldehyde dehydrogenase family protein, partial [Colwellia sp. RSH04]|uniref:aldehyde dehydrogenase family protein n=1 Tax=Colwellia sp. RSH04 TaxID=2305464 RepID=UPI000E56C98A